MKISEMNWLQVEAHLERESAVAETRELIEQ
jgi:hypothetical protein